MRKQREPGFKAGALRVGTAGPRCWGLRVTELLSALSLGPCWAMEGTPREDCLPISGHHPDSCLSCQPLDHIHPPELSGPSRAATGSAWVAGEGA